MNVASDLKKIVQDIQEQYENKRIQIEKMILERKDEYVEKVTDDILRQCNESMTNSQKMLMKYDGKKKARFSSTNESSKDA